jgi:ABC-type transport system involved in multi-copper enzyme maturation permease subunit
MTAITIDSSRPRGLGSAREALAGFRNFARKDLAEWFRTRRFLWTTLAATSLVLLGVLASRIAHTLDSSIVVTLDASENMRTAGWETLLPIFAVFSTMGIVVAERENRTLAWSLSMPLTRLSVLASKLLTSLLALAVGAVLIPEVIALAGARLAYGDFPNAGSIVWPAAAGCSLALLLISLNLASSVFFKSQRAVVGIALSVGMIIPGLVAAFWPAAVPWWPISMSDWVTAFGAGKPLQSITPVVWLAAVVVSLVAAKVRFDRDEL